jgi:hypothetical protein
MTRPAEASSAYTPSDVGATKALPTGRERTAFALRYILSWLFVSYDTNAKPLLVGRWLTTLWWPDEIARSIAARFGKGS